MEEAGWILIAALMVLSGLAWAAGVRRLRAGEPLLPRYERGPAAASPAALVVVGLWISLRISGIVYAEPSEGPQKATLDRVQESVAEGAAVFVILLLALLSTGRPADYGFRRDGWRGQLTDGTTGFVASWLPVMALLIATSALEVRSPETQHSFLRLLSENRDWVTVAWLALAVGLTAPLVEELLFRVVLQGNLAAWIGPRPAVGATAALFCAVHGWPDMLPLVPLALALGYVYERRHSFPAVVVAHGLFNLTMLAAQLTSPEIPAPEVDPPADETAPVAGDLGGSL